MSIGLIALLDDVAALAKAAAASLDDIAAQSVSAGTKAAGVVIDDAAVTPRYVTGFSPARELPVIWKITLGSLRNKLLILLPAALALSLLLPQAITPLLMLGGAYLSYEGMEKVYHLLIPHNPHDPTTEPMPDGDTRAFEEATIAGAIRTDFILSAEIMAITLASVPAAGPGTQASVLAVVGTLITVGVYGVVALIVKADDLGVVLAGNQSKSPPFGAAIRTVGRAIVLGMPYFLAVLGMVGTAAMIWVGGGILLHGLESYGFGWPSLLIEDASHSAAHAVPAISSLVGWLVTALGAGLAGIVAGLTALVIFNQLIFPIWNHMAPRRT